jgi:hypothetical protein
MAFWFEFPIPNAHFIFSGGPAVGTDIDHIEAAFVVKDFDHSIQVGSVKLVAVSD